MDKKKQYHKEYYIKNKEKIKQYYTDYHKENYMKNKKNNIIRNIILKIKRR